MLHVLMRVVAMALVAGMVAGCGGAERPTRPADAAPAASAPAPEPGPTSPGTPPGQPVGSKIAPAARPQVPPAPATDSEWDQWFDDRGRQVAEWLARPETWIWPDEQLAEWLDVQVFRSTDQPYRWVQFGPVRSPAGTMRLTQYWVQWQDDKGGVRSQALDPMDSGQYKGHRVFATDDGRRLLVVLLESVIAPNAASVWVWELDGGEWRPLADAFAGTAGEVLPGLFVDELGAGGLSASQVSVDSSSEPPPYVGFHETLDRPHFVLCGVSDLGLTTDCTKVLWTGDRFQVESKEFWGTAPRPMECRQLTLAGAADLWGGDFAWAEGQFGKPASQTTDGHRADWAYPEQGLTITFWGGSVAQVAITEGGLSSGLQVGDSLSRAIELHGRPAEGPDGELVWEYGDCLLELSARVDEGRITALRLLVMHLE